LEGRVRQDQGALSLGVSSRKLHDMAVERPHFIASLATVLKEGIVPVPGGILILDEAGTVIGAAGASGDSSDNERDGAGRRNRRRRTEMLTPKIWLQRSFQDAEPETASLADARRGPASPPFPALERSRWSELARRRTPFAERLWPQAVWT